MTFQRLLGIALVSLLAASLASAQAPPKDQTTVTLDTSKPLPSSPGCHFLECTVAVGAQKTPVTFGLFLPPAYFQSKEKFPVVVMLHNTGAKGHGNGALLMSEGLGMLVTNDTFDPRDPAAKAKDPVMLRRQAQFVGIAPQCPANWGFEGPPMSTATVLLVDEIVKKYRVDPDRVYVTGFSYGGTCTWTMGEQFPGRFAAIVPISGRNTGSPAQTAKTLMNMGVFVATGTADALQSCSLTMNEAFKAGKHPNYKFVNVPNGTHFCYPAIYTDATFWQWLFAQKRTAPTSAPTPKKP